MMKTSFRTGRFACTIALLLAMVPLGACATRSKISASNEIATAQFAIRDARENGAETYSLEKLNQAEALVEEAQQTSGADAERLAEKALVHAQLAAAVAEREATDVGALHRQHGEQMIGPAEGVAEPGDEPRAGGFACGMGEGAARQKRERESDRENPSRRAVRCLHEDL